MKDGRRCCAALYSTTQTRRMSENEPIKEPTKISLASLSSLVGSLWLNRWDNNNRLSSQLQYGIINVPLFAFLCIIMLSTFGKIKTICILLYIETNKFKVRGELGSKAVPVAINSCVNKILLPVVNMY